MATMASATDASLSIDLVVDTSAVIAVLLQEVGWEGILERLCLAMPPAVAAPTRAELLVVALAKLGAIGCRRTHEFLEHQAIATVDFDQQLADRAAVAPSDLGEDVIPVG
jgi:ribonuclease VapC